MKLLLDGDLLANYIQHSDTFTKQKQSFSDIKKKITLSMQDAKYQQVQLVDSIVI
jgi:hypothetical protein